MLSNHLLLFQDGPPWDPQLVSVIPFSSSDPFLGHKPLSPPPSLPEEPATRDPPPLLPAGIPPPPGPMSAGSKSRADYRSRVTELPTRDKGPAAAAAAQRRQSVVGRFD